MNARVVLALVAWWWVAAQSPGLPGPFDLANRALNRRPAAELEVGTTPYAELFETAGARHGVDPNLLAAIGHCESGYDANARSTAGARGLMQFMPATAAAYDVDPWDPAQAIDGAARYLADSTTQLGTSDPAILAASYNAGRAAVTRHSGIPPYRETRRYVTCVTNNLT